MFPNIPGGFNLTRLLGGISKSLNFANQVIPIYQQLSPMVQNARKAFSALKDMTNSSPNKETITNNNIVNKKRTINNSNNPSFFQ